MKFWNFKPSNSGEHLDLNIYGVIGGSWWDDESVSASEFINELQNHPNAKTITVHINSRGGAAFDGIAMRNALKQHPAKVTSIVEGLAASAASLILTQGETRMMGGSMVMIHEVSSYAEGNADAFEKIAARLRKIDDAIVPLYRDKTGISEERIRSMLKAETWLTAQEAKTLGFADSIDETQTVSARVQGENILLGSVAFPAKMLPQTFMNMATIQAKEKPMTLAELQEKQPELVAQIKNEGHAEGVAEERARIQAIENLAMPGFDSLVTKAKFEQPTNANQLAVEILTAQKAQAKQGLQNRIMDAAPLALVPASKDPVIENKNAEREQARAAFKAGQLSRRAK